MAGNSQRRGAVRRSGSKKGAQVGSGGQRKRGLEGKGPTPRASDRPNHKSYKGDRSSDTRGKGRPAPRKKGASTEVVAGRNSVLEALRTQVPVTTMYVASRIDADDRIRESLQIATAAGIPMLEAPRTELDRLTDGAVHQGIAIQVPPYEYAHAKDLIDSSMPGTPLIVALDSITDPRNLGAIVRSTAAFGGHGVLVPARRSAGMTASAWKTSAGAAARLPVAQAPNLTRALDDYRKAGFFVVGLDMEGDVELPGFDLATSPLVVVIGSEGKGLSRLVREACDQIISIPMTSSVESLNAGLAAGVTLYEIARLRNA